MLALLFFMTAAQMPIGETIAMREAGGDAGRYGRIRIWGSAGFIVGVVENVMGAFVIGTELKLTVALLVIILVLVVKPSGLFGKVFVKRV